MTIHKHSLALIYRLPRPRCVSISRSRPCRSFIFGTNPRSRILSAPRSAQQQWQPFGTSCARKITGEEAPSSKAYINSGIIAGAKNLVNVKKVLVIGSGGLSIGQAGEFDYSGTSKPMPVALPLTSYRLSSTQSTEGGQRQVGADEPQYRHHSDGSQAGR